MKSWRKFPDVEAIIVPIGGGGLVSGIATIVKEKTPGEDHRCSVRQRPCGLHLLKAEEDCGGEGQAHLGRWDCGPKGRRDHLPHPREKVDEIVTVDEDEIASAILMLMERKRIVAEGAGASSAGSLLSKRIKTRLKKIVLVISGGNIDLHLLDRIIEKGLAQTGRLVRLESS